MDERETDSGHGYFLLGVMLGAAVGAAIGLLYAPRPGAESRHDLAERSEDIYGRARTATSELGHSDEGEGEGEGESEGESDGESAAADDDNPGQAPL